MIKPLRKRHLQIWTAWAVLIPFGIIVAWISVPKKIADKLIQPSAETVLPVVINSIDKTNYAVALRSSNDKTQYQLEWINKGASVYPSSLIYKVSPLIYGGGLEGADLIGRVEAKGHYYFPLKKDSTANYNFILYDIIHKIKIDSLKFKIPL